MASAKLTYTENTIKEILTIASTLQEENQRERGVWEPLRTRPAHYGARAEGSSTELTRTRMPHRPTKP